MSGNCFGSKTSKALNPSATLAFSFSVVTSDNLATAQRLAMLLEVNGLASKLTTALLDPNKKLKGQEY